MIPTVDITNGFAPDANRRKQSRPILPQYRTAVEYNKKHDGIPLGLTPSRCSPLINLTDTWHWRWGEFKIDARVFYFRYCWWLPIVSFLTICTMLTHHTLTVRQTTSSTSQLHPFAANFTLQMTLTANHSQSPRPDKHYSFDANFSHQPRIVTTSVPEAQLKWPFIPKVASLRSWIFCHLRVLYSHALTFATHGRSSLRKVSQITLHTCARLFQVAHIRNMPLDDRGK